MFLGNTSIIRVRAPLATNTRDNSEYRNWGSASQLTITGCMVEPFLLSNQLIQETNSSREFASNYLRIWAPPTTDIVYTDRILYRGETWEVWGRLTPWYDFDDVLDHWNFLIRQREG